MIGLPTVALGDGKLPVRGGTDALSHLTYIADMNLVQRAWEEDSLDDVTRLLTEYRDSPERDFEWYYWHRLCSSHTQPLSDPPPTGQVREVIFSPNGTRLAMSEGNTVYLWDTSTRKRLCTLQGDKNFVFCLALSPDGKQLATGGQDASVKIWDTSTGRLLRTIDYGGEAFLHSIYSVAFSANGKRIAAGSNDGVKVWEVATGKEMFALPVEQSVQHVAFSPDDTQIVTGSNNAGQVWNAANGKLLYALGGMINTLDGSTTAFSKDGALLFVSRGDRYSGDYQADVWGAATGKKLFSLPALKVLLRSAAFSPDRSLLVTADIHGAIKSFDATTGAEIQHTTAPCRCVAFSPDGSKIYAAGEKEIKTFSTHNLDDVQTIHDDIHISVLSPDHKLLATSNYVFRAVHMATGKAELKIWDVATGKPRFTLKEHVGNIMGLRFTADGKRLISGGEDGKIKIWDIANGQCLLTISGKEGITAMDCSPDGTTIATGDNTGDLTFWDAATGKQLSQFQGHKERVESIAYSPDGKLLATGSYDDTVKVWDAATTAVKAFDVVAVQLLHTFSHPATQGWTAHFAVFTPDSGSLLTGGDNRTEAYLWSLKTFERTLTLYGSRNGIVNGSFSRDGRRIVTADEDGTARLYDTVTGRETLRLKHKEFLNSAVFSNDLTEIVTVSGSNTVQFWRSDYPVP